MLTAILVAILAFIGYSYFKCVNNEALDREAEEALKAVAAAREEVENVTKQVESAEIDYKSARDAYRAKYLNKPDGSDAS